MGDPLKLFDSKDIQAAALYAKRVASDLADLYPVLADAAGNLCVNMTVGTVSLSSTESTINNAVGNPVNVSITNTVVTAQISSTQSVVTAHLSPSTTKVTCEMSTVASVVTVHISPSTTRVTVSGSLTVSSISMTVSSVSITASCSVTNSVSSIMLTSKTLTTGSGTISTTNGTITLTPTNRAKVYAISLTTTCPTEVICIVNSGGVANGVELWRATLMAPAGASAGLNLAVPPPNFLFQSRSGTAVSLSLSSAVLVHYSVSYFDEA